MFATFASKCDCLASWMTFTCFSEFFHDTYNFKPGVGGLAYLGLGIGFACATVVGAKTADEIYHSVCRFLSA